MSIIVSHLNSKYFPKMFLYINFNNSLYSPVPTIAVYNIVFSRLLFKIIGRVDSIGSILGTDYRCTIG